MFDTHTFDIMSRMMNKFMIVFYHDWTICLLDLTYDRACKKINKNVITRIDVEMHNNCFMI